MANIKINGLALAGAILATMQLETDIGGVTGNKITIAQLQAFFNSTLSFAAASHTHAISDINNITAGKMIGDSDGAGTVGEISLGTEFKLTTGTLTLGLLGGQTF